MGKINLFEEIDRITQRVKNYRMDIDADKELLRETALSNNEDAKWFLYMTRINGTWLFRERFVYVKSTPQYNTWTYYCTEEIDSPKVYLIHITSHDEESVYGDIYEFPSYRAHAGHVLENAVPGSYFAEFEEGTVEITCSENIPVYHNTYGRLVSIGDPVPESETKMEEILKKERSKIM